MLQVVTWSFEAFEYQFVHPKVLVTFLLSSSHEKCFFAGSLDSLELELHFTV